MAGDQLFGQLIIRRTPYLAAVVAICSAMASVAAIGFSFMTWTPRRAAFSITSSGVAVVGAGHDRLRIRLAS